MLSSAVCGPETMLFHALLKGVPELVVNDLTQRVGMESVDDFLGYFASSSFEDEIKTYVDSVQDKQIPATYYVFHVIFCFEIIVTSSLLHNRNNIIFLGP